LIGIFRRTFQNQINIGVTYGAEIEIKNVGIDACRFRIRQPPLGTGLRVVFQPGLVCTFIFYLFLFNKIIFQSLLPV
jgi:hypothetical protein